MKHASSGRSRSAQRPGSHGFYFTSKGSTMRSTWILGIAVLLAPSFAPVPAQEPKNPLVDRESLNFTGWDPDETVPAHVYYKKGNKAMPIVIFMHGMGGFKEQYPARMEDWA